MPSTEASVQGPPKWHEGVGVDPGIGHVISHLPINSNQAGRGLRPWGSSNRPRNEREFRNGGAFMSWCHILNRLLTRSHSHQMSLPIVLW